MDLTKATVLVTGTNRGLGNEIAKALLVAGVEKLYAAKRVGSLASEFSDDPRVTSVNLDITDANQVAETAKTCSDVNILVNNAGQNFNVPLIGSKNLDATRSEIETNLFGNLQMCRAFAPILKNNNGGMIVNLISCLARVSIPAIGSVCTSKAALLLMNNGVRAELAAQGTHVLAVLPGPIDTDMTPGGESSPTDVASDILEAISNDDEEIWPGPMAENIRTGLLKDPKALEKEFAAYLPE